MITDYLHDFLAVIFSTYNVDTHYAMDFLTASLSCLICTIPIVLLLRPVLGDRVSKMVYLAVNISFFAVQAYSINGGIL